MYNGPRRRGGSNRLAEIHARQVPAEDHKGSYQDFLRRHRSESAIASRGANRQKAAFAECLLRRTADSRNLKCANRPPRLGMWNSPRTQRLEVRGA